MRAVLLDAYGTLVEPDWPGLAAGRDLIADRAGADRRAAHEAWAATHRARMRGAFGSLAGDLAAVFNAARPPDIEPIGDELLAELAALERANWWAGVRLYPDVPAALGRLRKAGKRLAIVTNASAEAAGAIRALGLAEVVDLVLASCDVGELKPELLGVALGRLGLDAREVTLVDDDPAEVTAARAIGIQAVLLRRGPAGAGTAAEVDGNPVLSDLTEVAELILRSPAGSHR